MIFGSTRVDVLRTAEPATEDGFGDPQETDTVALAGLPVWLEQGTLNEPHEDGGPDTRDDARTRLLRASTGLPDR